MFFFCAILRPLRNHGGESLLRIIKLVHYFYLIFCVMTLLSLSLSLQQTDTVARYE